MTDNQEISRLTDARELGLAFFKSLILLNSGAIVVLVTHMGTAKSDAAFSFSLIAIKFSMAAFLIGIVLILVSILISYVYTALSPAEKLKHWLDTKIIGTNAVLSLASLSCFVCGVAFLVFGANVTAI